MNETLFTHIYQPEFLPVGMVFNDITDIDSLAIDSISHMVIQDLLDFYTQEEGLSVLSLISSKIKPDGILEIQSIDLSQLGVSIASNEVGVDFAKKLLYSNKKNIFTLYEIVAALKALNFTIQNQKYINIFEYYISAIKNEA